MLDARYWLSAGGRRGGASAIACIELAGDVDRTLAALGVRPVIAGEVRRRAVPVGAARDDAVVARWACDRATVMTHGGSAVAEGFCSACDRAGLRRAAQIDTFVEAADEVEAAMLAALSQAQSAAAVDLLLDQPRRWRSTLTNGGLPVRVRSQRDLELHRLIEPALVVAVGPPNIGKSSLLNALAGRGVSVVADQPGTTRDHVGALIDLAGVVVRWVDTPGLQQGQSNQDASPHRHAEPGDADIQRAAQFLAREVAARADVLLVCSDCGPAGSLASVPATGGRVVRIGLRTDLGVAADVDAAVSVRSGSGLEHLVNVVRDAVVPHRYLEDGEPWVFWEPRPRT